MHSNLPLEKAFLPLYCQGGAVTDLLPLFIKSVVSCPWQMGDKKNKSKSSHSVYSVPPTKYKKKLHMCIVEVLAIQK
jgi:hypothetical protein